MAGGPPLRIGTHGKINRINQGRGKWLARCRYRDTDGITRIVEKLSPVGRYDQYGKLAEEELLAVLADRNRSTSDGGINADPKVAGLVEQYLNRLEEDGRSRVTMATHRFTTTKLKKFIGGLRGGRIFAGASRRCAAVDAQRPWGNDGQTVENDSAWRTSARGVGERATRQTRSATSIRCAPRASPRAR